MFTLFQDIRYALRQLRNAPVFTITAVLTLALGIGANSAVFTLVHEVLLKSLPVSNPGGLYRVGDRYECCVEGDLQGNWTMSANRAQTRPPPSAVNLFQEIIFLLSACRPQVDA